jgi:2-hydroxy-6-oxonona-2,4-dienedioate hydrolase
MNLSLSALAEGKFAEFTVPGSLIKAHYHEAGEGDQHAIFLQTGGAGTSAYMCWYMNLEAFAKAGYHVYAPDAVGFGLTEIISGAGVSAAEFVLAFMGRMGIERAHFVGNSMGSMTATRLALEHPGRVKSMILTGGEPRIETEESRAIARELGRTARMDFVRQMLTKPEVAFEDMKKATVDFFYQPDHPRIDEVAEMRLTIIRRPGVREKEREAAFRQMERGRSNYSSSDLAEITAPTYLIHGRDERFFYPKEIAPILLECATRVAFLLPDCSSTLLSHCGHWPQIERAETFNKLSLEFLRGLGKNGER